ncbi:ClpP family protease [Streptomyces sp. SM11]|uniref:ClpP family protease n=1 Tax=Streptomyces sp. SM11 TaxID=565557 RepID=UPI000CD52CA2|nr:ATP-dependent Clp protease proteolytic subunit [Streptomyces sp. SM11]
MSTASNRRAVAVILLVPLMVTLALWAFAWPAARIAPRDLPVGVAGAAPAAQQLEQRFEQRDGAFEVHRFDDEAAARAAIEDRAVYGAVVVTPQGPHLLTASAASPVVSQLLREAVTAAGAKGRRHALPGARVVIQQPALEEPMRGQPSDLEIHARELVRTREMFAAMLVRHTGQTAERITTDIERDTILDAKAAAAYGLVDHVVGSR